MKEKAVKMSKKKKDSFKTITVLVRNTTWNCGRIERSIVNYLRKQIHIFKRAEIPVTEMLKYFKLDGNRKKRRVLCRQEKSI